jgi:hypothetical protein
MAPTSGASRQSGLGQKKKKTHSKGRFGLWDNRVFEFGLFFFGQLGFGSTKNKKTICELGEREKKKRVGRPTSSTHGIRARFFRADDVFIPNGL